MGLFLEFNSDMIGETIFLLQFFLGKKNAEFKFKWSNDVYYTFLKDCYAYRSVVEVMQFKRLFKELRVFRLTSHFSGYLMTSQRLALVIYKIIMQYNWSPSKSSTKVVGALKIYSPHVTTSFASCCK